MPSLAQGERKDRRALLKALNALLKRLAAEAEKEVEVDSCGASASQSESSGQTSSNACVNPGDNGNGSRHAGLSIDVVYLR